MFRARGCEATVRNDNFLPSPPLDAVKEFLIAKPSAVDIEATSAALERAGYIPDRGVATALALCVALGRPLLLEGDAGVGKTEAARALALALGAPFLRLQCYEGIDVYAAAYDWNYGKQLLAIRAAEAERKPPPELYGPDFLIERPLLAALRHPAGRRAVLLIDEIDRADDQFEALLLEYLQDYALSIPELGRIAATHPPIVVLTSNRTRDLHDALKRRCFYHWLAHPSLEREIAILRAKVPGLDEALAERIARAAGRLRTLGLRKPPGVAEAVDWASGVLLLGAGFDEEALHATLGSVVKYPEDRERALAALRDVVA